MTIRTSYVASALLLSLLLSRPAVAGDTPTAAIGKAAPTFSVADETGKVHRLERYRGKLVVLEWTNPGCPFVKRHYRKKTMLRTRAAFAGKVVWLAVNSSYFNQPKDTRAWRKAQKLPYPTLQDPRGTLGHSYGARATPHMFVIDRRGVLRYAGAIDDDPHDEKKTPHNYVAETLKALLAGKPAPASQRAYGCTVKYKK